MKFNVGDHVSIKVYGNECKGYISEENDSMAVYLVELEHGCNFGWKGNSRASIASGRYWYTQTEDITLLSPAGRVPLHQSNSSGQITVTLPQTFTYSASSLGQLWTSGTPKQQIQEVPEDTNTMKKKKKQNKIKPVKNVDGFSVGDIVQFEYRDEDRIPSGYFCEDDGIPKKYICHGSVVVKDTSAEHTVSGLYKDYIIVRYIDENEKGVQIGFKSKDLILMKKGKNNKISTKLDIKHLDKLIINPITKAEIISVLKQSNNHTTIFEKWGLGETIEYGKGMTFLFHGDHGTGKKWGATLMAKALGSELLVLSAAEIQSSEPGAANRNIQNAFKEAKSKRKVLFLDECDSLIFDRSLLGMVLAGEVNTLLTEIEKFEGVCILATNRIAQLDKALERRISLIVEFPKPTFEQREAIWKTIIPKKFPLSQDINIKDLAKYDLTGGLIKNVLLNAARIASSENSKHVNKKHFDTAITRVQKSDDLMGHTLQHSDGYSIGRGVDKVESIDKVKVDEFFS